ncbi:Uma2 family endonuclease [Stratiformator vulcanicus]|uniref:Putative restriction endonuclease domain-containing protein n=1 Tax=Stratiformator vulcanicus TaxID=2527980 RepID=A0A517QY92_9PLAN|nr:Uma2 family endonuclease [Stratiformator vulcanicus]QDT36626.1 hypothetical protein Pan189_09860 [Stratiformator vulcanicus]
MILADSPTLTRLEPSHNGMLMTPDEFDVIDDAERGYRYELIHGVLVVSPPAGPFHRRTGDKLGYLLRSYMEGHPQGGCIDDTLPENSVIVGEDRRVCDRAIWVGLGREPDVFRDIPTIAIEIVSESARDRRRDYVDKAREYPAAGVKEYWIIDRFARELTIVLQGGTTQTLPESQPYQSPLLPGFELDLRELL